MEVVATTKLSRKMQFLKDTIRLVWQFFNSSFHLFQLRLLFLLCRPKKLSLPKNGTHSCLTWRSPYQHLSEYQDILARRKHCWRLYKVNILKTWLKNRQNLSAWLGIPIMLRGNSILQEKTFANLKRMLSYTTSWCPKQEQAASQDRVS